MTYNTVCAVRCTHSGNGVLLKAQGKHHGEEVWFRGGAGTVFRKKVQVWI